MRCKCGTLSITNHAGGKSFEYCRTCKDEVLINHPNAQDSVDALLEDYLSTHNIVLPSGTNPGPYTVSPPTPVFAHPLGSVGSVDSADPATDIFKI